MKICPYYKGALIKAFLENGRTLQSFESYLNTDNPPDINSMNEVFKCDMEKCGKYKSCTRENG